MSGPASCMNHLFIILRATCTKLRCFNVLMSKALGSAKEYIPQSREVKNSDNLLVVLEK